METKWIVKPRCPKTDRQGWLIKFGDGQEIMMSDGKSAHQTYLGIKGAKSLSVCDGGYMIPILSES